MPEKKSLSNKKRKDTAFLAGQIKKLKERIDELEETLVETIVDTIEMPKPKDGNTGDKGDQGEQGESIRGEQGIPGKNIKGDKGDTGVNGLSIKGDQGEDGTDGTDGLGFLTAKLNDKSELIIERTDGTIINAGKVRSEIIQRIVQSGGGGRMTLQQILALVADDLVPYEGAIKNVDLGLFDLTATQLNTDILQFNTELPVPSFSEGAMFYDTDKKLPGYMVNTSGISFRMDELPLRGTNKTGVTLLKGQVVYIDGAQGKIPTFALADASNQETSDRTIGIVKADIPINLTGWVLTTGTLDGVNTLGMGEGNPIYLSTTLGEFTATPPSSPDHLIRLGYVLEDNATTGEILVIIEIGAEVEDLHDINYPDALQDWDYLRYNTANLLWENTRGQDVSITASPTFAGATLSGMTEGSLLWAGPGGLVSQDNPNLFWNNSITRLGIGVNSFFSSNPGLHIMGDMELDHTALESDDHALEIVADTGGFGDVKAIDINYITNTIGTAQEEGVILINIDESASTGGEVFGLEIVTTTLGSADVIGMKTGIGIDPIGQFVGTFNDPASFLVKTVDQLAAISDGGAGNITFFVADNDTITIGLATKFEEIEILINTGASGAGIRPKFEFSTGIGTWSEFTPTDGTNGFRNTGVILFDDATVPSWATGTGTEFLIRITRQRNSLTTVPIVDVVQVSAVTVYKWDKNGNIIANNITTVTQNPGDDSTLSASTAYVEAAIIASNQTTSGTANRIQVTNGSTNPIIDISSSYVGQTSITTVGTIATGTWSGLFGAVTGANLTSLTAANISAGTAGIDISGTAANVTTNANLTGDVTSIGNATTLATVNSNTGSFGSSTAIPSFTVNAKGLMTAAGTNAVIAPAGTLTGTTLNSTVVTSSLTSLGTLSTLNVSGISPFITIENTLESEAGLVFTDSAAPLSQVASILYNSASPNGLRFYHNTNLIMTLDNGGIDVVGSITTATWDGATVAVDKGGSGQTSYTNGQLLIGNTTGNTLTKATLTEGEGIDITNGTGTITISGEDASTTNKGISELATDAETNTGTDTGRTITPSNLAAWTGSTNIATLGTVTTGVWDAGAITSSGALSIDGAGDSYFTGMVGFGETSPAGKIHCNQSSSTNTELIILENPSATAGKRSYRFNNYGLDDRLIIQSISDAYAFTRNIVSFYHDGNTVFQGDVTAANLSGTNTGDQTITLTGDVTGSGTGSFATTLATVTVAKGGTGSTSFTSGSIPFSNGTILTQDNANLFWDDANNRLGIGTITPSNLLDIDTTVASEGAEIGRAFVGNWAIGTTQAVFAHKDFKGVSGSYAILQDTSGAAFINAATGQAITMRINNATTPLVITSDSDVNMDSGTLFVDASTNRVGIGTTTPLFDLHVANPDGGSFGQIYVNGTHANIRIEADGASNEASIDFYQDANHRWKLGLDNGPTGGQQDFQIKNTNNGTPELNITSTGSVTMPFTPAFFVRRTSTVTSVTGDGTIYTVVFDSETFDQGADMSTTTFTADVDGIYDFTCGVRVQDLVSAGCNILIINLVTSNANINLSYRDATGVASIGNDFQFTASANRVQMDAGDTAHVTVYAAGGTKTVDIYGLSSTRYTYFSGGLAC